MVLFRDARAHNAYMVAWVQAIVIIDNMPDLKSSSIKNAYFVGDLVRTRHGSWSQEKAFVTGKQAANVMLGRDENEGVVPLKADEVHVDAGRKAVGLARTVLGGGDAKRGPSLVDFLW